MKKLLFIIVALVAWTTSYAQYFGATIFKEGFDSETFPTTWQQKNQTTSELWEIEENDFDSFSEIDETSTQSAKLELHSKETQLTLTSPEIDLSGKSNLQVGFYGYELSYCFSGGVDFRFRVTKDDGKTWENLFSSQEGDSYNTELIKEWNLYKYILPSQFNGAKIHLQFYVDASTMKTNPRGLEGYIDGIFISELPAIEPQITQINYSTDSKRPTTNAYGDEEPIIISFVNNGSQPITTIQLYYQIEGQPEVAETYVPQPAILSGETSKYTFTRKADFITASTSFSIKAGIRMEGDENMDNNELTGYLKNVTAQIPYIPSFVNTEEGRVEIGDDQWTTIEKSDNAYWDNNYDNPFYWYIEPEYADNNCDAYLLSRPVWLEEGKTYSIKFNAYSANDGSNPNKMVVYATNDKNLETPLNEIWRNEAIGNDNTLNQFARYTVPSTGIYYFVFNCISSPEAGEMRVDNIAIREVSGTDAGIIGILSPVNNQYLFGASESVKVLIQNLGMSTIPAGQMKINMRINNGETISETIAETLEPNAQLVYTFPKAVDFSDVNTKHLLSVWTSLPGDQNAGNDGIITDYISTVTGIPYIPDFGTTSQKSEELSFWTIVNKNGDYYTFSAGSDNSLNTNVFSYGGGIIGQSLVTIPTSDEQICSRPIRLETGIQYKLSFLSKVGKTDASMPLAVNIYKVEDGVKTLVKNIWNSEINSPDYQETVLKIEIDKTGIYEFEFSVVDAQPIDFKIFLGMFRITQTYDIDLSLEEIVIPTSISCYNSVPIGAIIKNEGKNVINAFSLKANSLSTGEIIREFSDISLAPNDIYLVYFDRDMTFNGTDEETFTLSVTAKGDGDEANNIQSIKLTYIDPETIPYIAKPLVAIDNWTVINENKDACRFIPVKNGSTIGFQYTGDQNVTPNDLVVTPCLTLEKDAIYKIDFNFGVTKGDTTAFEVYAYDVASQKQVAITHLEQVTKGSEYIGYFSVPADGNYNICFKPSGNVPSLFISANARIDKVTDKPDIQLSAITTPVKDAIFSAKEKLIVTFLNKGKLPLSCIPFTCKIGNKEYHSFCSDYISVDDDTYTMEFPEIDLYTPGEYDIQVTADVLEDATPTDNTLSVKIKSLPIVDAAIVSLDSPKSGLLSNEESVTITIGNAGKGILTNIPVQCVVTAGSSYSKTLTGTIAGPIADGESIQYTFDEKINLYEEMTYHFVVTANMEGDINEENSRLETSVNSTHKDFDAGVTAVLNPVNAILTLTETVRITAKNYSEVDLFDVLVTAEITYPSDAATTPQILTGIVPEIKSGESAEYTFTQTANMKKVGEYRIKAYTSVNNDVNPDNDACTVTVKCQKQDVGVIAIISPESGEELGSQEVTIKVKNFGEAAISQIPVRYKIGTMPQLGTITETIQPGETTDYTFPAKYEFIAYKKYAITASTELEEDVDNSNDTFTKEIENINPSSINSITTNSVALYPNPSAGEISIFTAGTDIQTIWICNMQGSILEQYNGINAPVHQMRLGLPEGSYIVRIMTSTGISNLKLMIKR